MGKVAPEIGLSSGAIIEAQASRLLCAIYTCIDGETEAPDRARDWGLLVLIGCVRAVTLVLADTAIPLLKAPSPIFPLPKLQTLISLSLLRPKERASVCGPLGKAQAVQGPT